MKCGEKLGDMTNELGPDEYIQKPVSGGLKDYTYRAVNARAQEIKTVYKIRGITPNYTTALLVNFDSIRDLILGAIGRDVITVPTESKIKRKMRKCDGSGMSIADKIVVLPEP